MPQTLTLVHAPIGGPAAGQPAVREVVGQAARAALEGAAVGDSYVLAHGGMLSLTLLHEAGERDGDVHRAAWGALDAAMEAARGLGAPGLGEGLPIDAFAGSLSGTGISIAELVLTERPVGPVVALLASGVSLGTLNLPLARAFADPFSTPRLVETPSMRRGFHFEVHDLEEPRKRMFAAPAEFYELLATVSRADRYLLRGVVTAEGAPAAVASTARRAEVLGSGDDDAPIALVRTGGDAPSLQELAEALRVPQIVAGAKGAMAPLLPVPVTSEDTARPQLVALAFHVTRDRLLPPVDLFASPDFDDARREASRVARVLASQGAFAPRTPRLDEGDGAPGGDASRWSER